MRLPIPEGLKSWRLEARLGGKLLKEFKGQTPPTVLLFDGDPAADFTLYASGADGAEKKGEPGQALTRSFKYENGGVRIQRVHACWFAQGESEIQPEMFGRLERVAKWLKERPEATLIIQGHSSKEGSAAFNDRLAEARAKRVRDWLIQEKGMKEEDFELKGYGTSMLLDQGASEDSIRRNRRIDILSLQW
jgi:outer membrane protein OmpA-like peptidoglycan-associated protein